MTADLSEKQFDRSIALNLRSVWLCMKAEIRQMPAQQLPGGAILNTSSVTDSAASRRDRSTRRRRPAS